MNTFENILLFLYQGYLKTRKKRRN